MKKFTETWQETNAQNDVLYFNESLRLIWFLHNHKESYKSYNLDETIFLFKLLKKSLKINQEWIKKYSNVSLCRVWRFKF